MLNYCPHCGAPGLKFLRQASFGQTVYDCDSCKQISIIGRNAGPPPEPAKPEPTENQPSQMPVAGDAEGMGTPGNAGEVQEEAPTSPKSQPTAQPRPAPEPIQVAKPEPANVPDFDMADLLKLASMDAGKDIHVQDGGEMGSAAPSRGPIDKSMLPRSITHHGPDLDRSLAKDIRHDSSRGYSNSDQEQMKLNVFCQRLGNVMKDNQFDRAIDNQKRGKLTPRNLFKVMTGSDKVFSRKLERKNKKYAVVIAVDQSGSMRGQGADYTAACIGTLLRGLQRHRIRFGVVGFGGDGNTPIHKKLEDHYDDLKIKSLENKIAAAHGNTPMFAGLMEASRMLARKDEDEQAIVMLLTDGTPDAGGHCTDRFGRTCYKSTGQPVYVAGKEQITSEAEHFARIGHFIPISIQCNGLKEWFPNAHVVYDLTHFTDIVLSEFGKAVQRG